MINCPKCDADNQIGAIFCRACGEKLDLDEIKPDAVRKGAKKQTGEGANWFVIIKNTIMLGFLIGVVGILVGFFLPPSLPDVTGLSKGKGDALMKKYRTFQQGGAKSLSWTSDEANHMIKFFFYLSEEEINKDLKEKAENGESGMMEREMLVEFLGSDRVRIVMLQQHNKYEWLKFYNTIEGDVRIDEELGRPTIDVDKSAFGKIPMGYFDFTKEVIIKRFGTLYGGKDNFQALLSKTKKISITDDKLTMVGSGSFKQPKPVKKGRRRRSRR